MAPPIPGLAETGFLTNETIFDLTERPQRLLVVGAGAIGCELAQAFALLGSEVVVSDVVDRPLSREDADASACAALARSRWRAFQAWRRTAAHQPADADAILVAAGRAPNVEDLNLTAAGIRHGRDGIEVTDRLQTTNPRVFAAGDVASPFKFTTRPMQARTSSCRTRCSFGVVAPPHWWCPGAPTRSRRSHAWVTSRATRLPCPWRTWIAR